MTIQIQDYLTEEERKQIAVDAFRAECAKRSSTDFERIITNSAYHVVWAQIDEFCDKSVVAKLKNKVRSIIEGLTEFHVFKKPDAWDRGSNKPYDILVQCVQENKALLNEKVETAMHQLPNKEMRPILIEAMKKTLK